MLLLVLRSCVLGSQPPNEPKGCFRYYIKLDIVDVLVHGRTNRPEN